MAHDPELARAATLSSKYYLDPSIFELEQERIFRRTWQWVGNAADVEHAGDYFCCDVSGEPVVIARDLNSRLHALSNVCRHRAGPVTSGQGCRKQLQCEYHGWTYALDGRLSHAPEMEGVDRFDVASLRLPRFQLEEWASLLFVTLDREAPPWSETTGEISKELDAAGFDVARMRRVAKRDYFVDSNWKAYVDNFLEGYHIPHVHPALFRELDYEKYRVDTFRSHSSQHAPLRRGSPADGERRYLPSKEGESALHYWVFPNLMLNFYPTNLQANLVLPVSANRTRVVFEWFTTAGELTPELERDIALGDQVQREDAGICAAVQRGLASPFYDRGRYSVRRENGVHHFHQLYAAKMAD